MVSKLRSVWKQVFVVGWLVWLGWRLGVLESMCMAISVGICVDFICHCAHAYSHAPQELARTRADRVAHVSEYAHRKM